MNIDRNAEITDNGTNKIKFENETCKHSKFDKERKVQALRVHLNYHKFGVCVNSIC